VKRFADAVTIMRGGKTVAKLDPRQSSAEELTELTVGQTSALPERTPHQGGPTRLNVGALTYTRGDHFKPLPGFVTLGGDVTKGSATANPADPSVKFDPSLLDMVSFSVGPGDYNFCIRDFRFLDASGQEVVTP